MPELHLQDTSSPFPRAKQAPKSSSIPVPFSYFPSDDGTDENVLILLHGLGDTHLPFSKLGRQLRLPQTAVLALRAPEQIPFLYEDSYQWYMSFDNLGEMIERPNPTPALDLLAKIVDHLTKECKWFLHQIHFFGFAQGGSVASEFGLRMWKHQLSLSKSAITASTTESDPTTLPQTSFGSIVTVSGPFLSYPTLSSPSPTPILVAHRPPPSEVALAPNAIKSFQKGYQSVTEIKLESKGGGMPASKEEWEPVMRFWSEKLGRRQADGLYAVMSGMAS